MKKGESSIFYFFKILRLIGLVSFIGLNFAKGVKAEEYQTTCYHKRGNELVFPQDCSVILTFDHPQNGIDWRFLIEEKPIQHYRNLGKGIEVWSEQQDQWIEVNNVTWFSLEEGILCWGDFCANWQEFPLD